MSASTYVGRIGALAAALGVGAALFSGPGIAWADTTSSDTSGSSAAGSPSDSQPDNSAKAAPTRGHSARSARTPRTPQQSSDAGQSAPEAGTPDVPAAIERDVAPVRTGGSAESARQQTPGAGPAPAATVKANNTSAAVKPAAADPVADVAAPSPAPASIAPVVSVPAPAASQAVTSLLETVQPAVAPKLSVTSKVLAPSITFPAALAGVASHISTVINSVVSQLVSTFSSHSPFGPQANSPINWLVLAAARRQPLSAATTASAVSLPATPTLVLNGYSVVANSIQTIDAFTGRWAYWPGQPNMLQGRQGFDLVDPNTGAKLGSFDALITTGDPTSLGSKYVEMLVTANDGTNVGTGAGQTPPVGSVISDFTLGLVGISYSAMPSPDGAKVSVKLRTPFATIPLPLTFNASKGIADHTFDNRPMDVTGGYYIAPATPDGEKVTGSIGSLPLFNSLQGVQKFAVYDSTGAKAGTFDGLFTTTSDTIGIYTQEIRVIANDGVNVGSNPGQTPPTGTIYNVAYFGSDKTWLLYSAAPQSAGGAITLKFGTPKGVTDLTKLGLPKWLFPQVSFNAADEPPMKPMIAPGGQKFVPTSPEIPSGINGLPPRDMQTQGYQQFDVYDFLGRKIGTVDADVESQWDSSSGPHSKAILITKVTSGNVGTTPLNVPPPGTVMNFIDFGIFGISDSVIPQNVTNLNSFMIITPFGNLPLLPSISVATHPEVKYTNPFVI